MRAGVRDPGVARRQRGEGVVDRRRVRQGRAQVVGDVQRCQLRLPQVAEVRRRSVRGQAADDLGRRDQCVVGAVGHRTVTGRAGDPQAPPRDALFGDVDRHVAGAVVVDRRPPARLGEHVVGADRVPVLVDHVLGAPLPAGFFVGDAEVDQRALGPEALGRQLAERHRHRRRDVEHVDGAAAPHLAVDQLAGEWVAGPPIGVHRHDVGVAHQAQRRCRGVAALDAGDDRGPAGPAVESLHVEPGALEVRLQQVGVAHLVAGVGGAVVDALVADQLLQELGRRPGELLGTRHASNLARSPHSWESQDRGAIGKWIQNHQRGDKIGGGRAKRA